MVPASRAGAAGRAGGEERGGGGAAGAGALEASRGGAAGRAAQSVLGPAPSLLSPPAAFLPSCAAAPGPNATVRTFYDNPELAYTVDRRDAGARGDGVRVAAPPPRSGAPPSPTPSPPPRPRLPLLPLSLPTRAARRLDGRGPLKVAEAAPSSSIAGCVQ
ncbi:hypothetical protein ACP70R_042835 [Stipagrostis hirtigluma subsp. patula]